MKILSIEGENELTFFPNEKGDGVKISQDEMRLISKEYHLIYDPIVRNLSKQINKYCDLKSNYNEIIFRYALIPLIHSFLDRLIRLDRFVKKNGSNFLIQEIGKNCFFTPMSTSEFRKNLDKNYKFNNYFISYISKLWDIGQVRGGYSEESVKVIEYNKINNLSRIYSRNIINGLKFRLSLFLSKIFKGRIPAFGLAYSKAPLIKYGFYIKLFDDLDLTWEDKDSKTDHSLREKIFTSDIFECNELNNFYRGHNISLDSKNLNAELCNFVKLFFPLESLELFESNLNNARRSIEKYNSKYIVVRGGGAKGKFIIAAAKERKMKIVGVQHGGYYGYINDMHQTIEYEYRDLDIFISWGWRKLPDYNFLQNLKIVELPSPWLSERRKYWKSQKFRSKVLFDVLFMPSGVTRFPLSVRGAMGPRIDVINDLSKNIKDTFKVLIESNISLLFKPYNELSNRLLTKTMNEMNSNYGDKFSVVNKIDKGFTKELISSCGLILWNQPGTGFLECLSAEIPSMVFWNRFSTQEEDWAVDIFNKLEELGIIHSTKESLVKEIKIFKASPKKWMTCPKRVKVVEEFCFRYARHDNKWNNKWNNFFNSLD